MLCLLFISAAVAEGGILCQGYFITVVLRVSTLYSLYTRKQAKVTNVWLKINKSLTIKI